MLARRALAAIGSSRSALQPCSRTYTGTYHVSTVGRCGGAAYLSSVSSAAERKTSVTPSWTEQSSLARSICFTSTSQSSIIALLGKHRRAQRGILTSFASRGFSTHSLLRQKQSEADSVAASQRPGQGVPGGATGQDVTPAPGAEQNSTTGNATPLGQHEPQKLSEDIMTIPNVLTMVRLASTPVLGYLIIIDEMRYAFALLAVAGFTDALDGWLARRYGSATVFGSIADPAADKALMTVMVGALAWRGLIPLPLVVLIIGRDVALIMSAFLIRWRSLPLPKTFTRYFDPRLPSAKVMPTQVSKYNTLLQIVLVGICTLLASLSETNRQWWAERRGLWSDQDQNSTITKTSTSERDTWGDYAKKSWHAFMILVSATTIWSGASYLTGAGAVNVAGKGMRTSAAAARKPPVPRT